MYTSSLRSSLLAISLLSYCNSALGSPSFPRSCPHTHLGLKFNFVIVGGGTSGLVLANRLTEQPDVKVAVIEAGNFIEDSTGNLSQIPYEAFRFDGGEAQVEWNFKTTPQTVSPGTPSLSL